MPALGGGPLDGPAPRGGRASSSSPSTWPAHGVEVDAGPRRAARARMPLSSATSPRGRTGRWTSATIAVFVTRGSTTMTVAAASAEHARREQRVVVGDVGAPQHDDVGELEVLVAAGRAVGAEAQLVAGHRAGHAQRGVAVVVAQAHAEPHELAERVELLGHELAGRQHGDRLRAVLVERVAGSRRPRGRARRPTSPAGRRPIGVVSRPSARDRVVLGQALRAQPAAVDRVVGVALHGDGPAVAHAEQHPAADRAVAAGRAHPPVGGAAGADRPAARLVDVGVAVAAVVDAEQPADRPELPTTRHRVAPGGAAPERAGHVERDDGDEEQPAADQLADGERAANASDRRSRPARAPTPASAGDPAQHGPRPEPAQLEAHRAPPRLARVAAPSREPVGGRRGEGDARRRRRRARGRPVSSGPSASAVAKKRDDGERRVPRRPARARRRAGPRRRRRRRRRRPPATASAGTTTASGGQRRRTAPSSATSRLSHDRRRLRSAFQATAGRPRWNERAGHAGAGEHGGERAARPAIAGGGADARRRAG